jgi:DNA primase
MRRNAGSPQVKRPVVDHYEDRFTVDIDAKPGKDLELQAVKTWNRLLDVADAVDVHVSSSGQGLHFVAYLKDSMPFYKKVAMRRTAGDDARRVDMEIQRWHAGLDVDVLFNQKDVPDDMGGVKTKERRFADVYDALDFIRAQRDDADRVRRLAVDGHKGAPDLARKANL